MLKIGLTGNIACGKSFIAKLFTLYGVRIVDSDLIAREVVEVGSPALDEIAKEFGSHVLNEDGSLNRQALRAIVFADKDKLAALNAITHPAIRKRTEELCELCAQGLPFPASYHKVCAQTKAMKAQARDDKSMHETKGDHSHELNNNGVNLGTLLVNDSQTEEGQYALTHPLDPNAVLNPMEKPPYIILDIPLLFENHLEPMVDRILVIDAARETQIARILQRDGCSLEVAQNIIDKQFSRDYKLQHADDIIVTDRLSIEEKRANVLKLHLNYLELARGG